MGTESNMTEPNSEGNLKTPTDLTSVTTADSDIGTMENVTSEINNEVNLETPVDRSNLKTPDSDKNTLYRVFHLDSEQGRQIIKLTGLSSQILIDICHLLYTEDDRKAGMLLILEMCSQDGEHDPNIPKEFLEQPINNKILIVETSENQSNESSSVNLTLTKVPENLSDECSIQQNPKEHGPIYQLIYSKPLLNSAACSLDKDIPNPMFIYKCQYYPDFIVFDESSTKEKAKENVLVFNQATQVDFQTSDIDYTRSTSEFDEPISTSP